MSLKTFLKINNIKYTDYGNICINDIIDTLILNDTNYKKKQIEYYLSPIMCRKMLSRHKNKLIDFFNLIDEYVLNKHNYLHKLSIYLISTPEHMDRNEYKVGKYSGSLSQLISRYATPLIIPLVFCYIKVNNFTVIETKILEELDEFRMINVNGNKSEWIKLKRNKIISIIQKNVNKFDYDKPIEIIDNTKIFLPTRKILLSYANHDNLFVIIDNNDKIWFAANDIATILEYKAPQKIIEKFVPNKYKKQYQYINVNNKNYSKKYQNKSMFINEIGLFRLSIKSKQPKAVELQEWITDEVLPELRREGNYRLEEKIIFLKNKLDKVTKINKKLLIENDYLRGGPDEPNKNILYIIRIPTTIRGKSRICYKLGITDDIKQRMRTYRTGNPNIDLISYFIIKNLDAITVEDCVKSVLKFKELKKNNEIFCESLKNIYNLLESCIDNGEIVNGICYSCKQKINIDTLYSHRHCFDKYLEI